MPTPGAPSRLDALVERARRTLAAQGMAAPVDVPAPAPAAGGAAGGGATPAGRARVVLGIDPGTATMGYGVVRVPAGAGDDTGLIEPLEYGVIETPAGTPMPERLLTLHGRLRELLVAHRPTDGAVELLFFGRNVTTAVTVGQARGVALLALAQSGLPVSEYTPLQVKLAITGFGRADKSQMQRMVQTLLGLAEVPRPDDAADALAICLCHVRMARVRAMGLTP